VANEYRELLLGSGTKTNKRIYLPERPLWLNVTTLDISTSVKPDVVWDLNEHPLPFEDKEFDEIHAYEVLEHLGKQGDWKFWCNEWNEYYRILKADGIFCATVPSVDSKWLWGDPGHTRAITTGSLTFLNQKEYEEQIGVTAMTDYREWYNGDFNLVYSQDDGDSFAFILQKC
jgi:SAM-dependent methyltransferase